MFSEHLNLDVKAKGACWEPRATAIGRSQGSSIDLNRKCDGEGLGLGLIWWVDRGRVPADLPQSCTRRAD